jgi:hypothetical protein
MAPCIPLGDPRADSVQVRRVPVHVADAAEHSAGLEPAAVVFAFGVEDFQPGRPFCPGAGSLQQQGGELFQPVRPRAVEIVEQPAESGEMEVEPAPKIGPVEAMAGFPRPRPGLCEHVAGMLRPQWWIQPWRSPSTNFGLDGLTSVHILTDGPAAARSTGTISAVARPCAVYRLASALTPPPG